MIKDTLNFGPGRLTIGAVYAGLLIGIYYSTFAWLIARDWTREDYSASMLIPLVVLYLIWEKRDALSLMPSRPSWAGIAVMLAGGLLYWLGELGGEFFALYFSSWLLFSGLCWLHLGWRKLKIIAFPVVLLLAMFPLPHFIHGKLSLSLKLISSQIGVKMMQWMGMSAYREGNVIDLGFTQLQVVDACNGLRYLIPLIILGLIMAYFFKTAWWKRTLLVLSTIPIAVLVNSLRIASVGVLYPIWGPKVAEGFFHDFSGWFIFMLTVGFLMAFIWLLKFLPPKQSFRVTRSADNGAMQTRGPSAEIGETGEDQIRSVEIPSGRQQAVDRRTIASPHFLCACCLLGLTLAVSFGVEFHEQMPMKRSLSEFPSTVAGWEGRQLSMEQMFLDELDLSEYLMADYNNGEDKSVNFYVAYYESQRKGESIHSPETCLPGGGWVFNESGTVEVPIETSNKTQLPVNRAFIQKGESRQLSYYWFPMRGRVLTNAYEVKFFNFWDALTRQRTDGALVRLITPVYEGEDVALAEARLQDFVKQVVPVLNDFLPN